MDVRTLFIVLFFVNLFLGVFTFVLKLSQPRFKFFNFWIAANLLIAFGYLFYALRGIVADWVSVFGANFLLAFGSVFRLLGLKKLFNSKITVYQIWLVSSGLVLFILVMNLFFWVVNDILVRNVFIAIFYTIIGIYGGMLVISNAPPKGKGVYYILGGISFIFVAVLDIRIISWVLFPVMRELFYVTLVSDIQFLTTIVLDIAWTMLFLYIAIQESIQKEVESDEKFKYLAKNTSDGIIIFDSKNQIVFTSPSYLIQIGHVGDEKYFMSDKEIYQNIHPDDREVVFKRFYEAIAQKKTNLVYKYRVMHNSGHSFWREDTAQFNYDASGKYVGAVIICRQPNNPVN
ncbi:MAG TPA: hypothetical protein DCQ31_15025, partial [Bacteroidales bacterium]|nr:hypothetical protein [Bacteroidales bacterium]